MKNYFITAINIKESSYGRCFGYSAQESIAKEWVENNIGSLHENFYTHVVIEKIPPGIHCQVEEEFWFEWKNDKWNSIPCRPKEIENVTNFAIG